MTLTFVLLTSTDTTPPALAYFMPAPAYPLSTIRVAEEIKRGGPPKTIVLLLYLLTQRTITCCHPPNFQLG